MRGSVAAFGAAAEVDWMLMMVAPRRRVAIFGKCFIFGNGFIGLFLSSR
jgi:hypothetical protein